MHVSNTNIENCKENDRQALLKEILDADILGLSTEELLEYINMNKQQKKEQELLKQHIENFYHIWQNKNGVYLSYLPASDKPKGRWPVTAATLEKLEQKIIHFYLQQESALQKEQEKSRLSTLRAIYPQWLKYKNLETTATTYIRRIDTDWKKYYAADGIIDIDIHTFTKAGLKEWALAKIRSLELTKRQYYNMSVIIRQCLDYAADHGVIQTNPYNEFKIDAKLFRKVKKPEDCTQVFLKTERPLIEEEAWKEFEEKGCTTALAVPLAFQTGVRLGELVALKSTDISGDGKYLHIHRMIQRQERQKEDGTWYPARWVTVDYTKSDAGDRYVYLTKEARRIIKIIQQANENAGIHDRDFLFIHGGKLITPRAIDTRIRKYCEHINIDCKSTHKVRKSYISTLLDAGININEVRKQVGHEDERTTLHNYCFNRNNQLENESDMEKALAG